VAELRRRSCLRQLILLIPIGDDQCGERRKFALRSSLPENRRDRRSSYLKRPGVCAAGFVVACSSDSLWSCVAAFFKSEEQRGHCCKRVRTNIRLGEALSPEKQKQIELSIFMLG
jgi:hypothetical protein